MCWEETGARQNVGTEFATWNLVADGHKQMFQKRKVSRRPALGPGCPHRLSWPQHILCTCLPLRRTVPPFFTYYHHLHLLPRHLAPCPSCTASNSLYTLPISTSLHRLTRVYGGRAALPCHPPTYPLPIRQRSETRRHRM